ncbi:hypothetical protein SAY86_021015 [Trapa natans]|uniref:Uncharacterized protein n=1 Tax=Trapa natans TaxID=22666 RepID=A0AAN7MYE7_TRANT|nr:hypothetical protein SAY86_021015 [Trapa natans]
MKEGKLIWASAFGFHFTEMKRWAYLPETKACEGGLMEDAFKFIIIQNKRSAILPTKAVSSPPPVIHVSLHHGVTVVGYGNRRG